MANWGGLHCLRNQKHEINNWSRTFWRKQHRLFQMLTSLILNDKNPPGPSGELSSEDHLVVLDNNKTSNSRHYADRSVIIAGTALKLRPLQVACRWTRFNQNSSFCSSQHQSMTLTPADGGAILWKLLKQVFYFGKACGGNSLRSVWGKVGQCVFVYSADAADCVSGKRPRWYLNGSQVMRWPSHLPEVAPHQHSHGFVQAWWACPGLGQSNTRGRQSNQRGIHERKKLVSGGGQGGARRPNPSERSERLHGGSVLVGR